MWGCASWIQMSIGDQQHQYLHEWLLSNRTIHAGRHLRWSHCQVSAPWLGNYWKFWKRECRKFKQTNRAYCNTLSIKVPEAIISLFLSLGDNSNHQPTGHHQIEDDCTLVCAHNFPAVLLTAGASHWDSLFRDKYMRLAKDHQIKVRSSFAHSLHAIAKIIGPVRTLNDLVHIFALYLMDVDEVKYGVMEHLADFFGALDAKDRSEYLPVLMEIWESVVTSRAFRKILVDQLILITPLCTLGQFVEHVMPLVLYACQDEVAIIRDSAAKVVSRT